MLYFISVHITATQNHPFSLQIRPTVLKKTFKATNFGGLYTQPDHKDETSQAYAIELAKVILLEALHSNNENYIIALQTIYFEYGN